MDSNIVGLPETISAREVMSRLGGVTRATLTRWMNRDEATKRGFSRPFPHGIGEEGRAKWWQREEVEDWINDNPIALGNLTSDSPRHIATLPLGRVINAVETATDGAVSSRAIEQSIERHIRKALRHDDQVAKALKSVKIVGDEIEFEFDESAKNSFVYFLLKYR